MKMKTMRDESWKSLAGNSVKQNLPPILEKFDWRKPAQFVLDYGCGSGQVGIDYLLPKCREHEAKLFCIDKSAALIKSAKKNYPDSANTFLQGNILMNDDDHKLWPLKDKIFDKVLAIQVLQHVSDLGLFFRKIYTQLHTGGQFGAIVPLDCTLHIKVRELLTRVPNIGMDLANAFPIYGEWSKGLGSAQYVQGMAKEAGFTVTHFEIVQTSYTYMEIHCLAAHFMSLLTESAVKRKLEDDWGMMERIEDFLVIEIKKFLHLPPDAKSVSKVGHTLQIVMEKR